MNDYDGFIDDIKGLHQELEELSASKVKEEERALEALLAGSVVAGVLTMGAGFLVGGGAVAAVSVSGVGDLQALDWSGSYKKVLGFGKKYCFDLSSTEQAIAAVSDARKKFDIQNEYDDINDNLEAAWPAATNETAKLFEKNYVTPIIDKKDYQGDLLALAKDDLEGVPEMVKENRSSLKGMLNDAIDKLNDFDVYQHVGMAWTNWALFAWGLAAPDSISGGGSGIVDRIISDTKGTEYVLETSVSKVADFFTAIQSAVDEADDRAEKVIGGINDNLYQKVVDMEKDDVKYVLDQPGQDAPQWYI